MLLVLYLLFIINASALTLEEYTSELSTKVSEYCTGCQPPVYVNGTLWSSYSTYLDRYAPCTQDTLHQIIFILEREWNCVCNHLNDGVWERYMACDSDTRDCRVNVDFCTYINGVNIPILYPTTVDYTNLVTNFTIYPVFGYLVQGRWQLRESDWNNGRISYIGKVSTSGAQYQWDNSMSESYYINEFSSTPYNYSISGSMYNYYNYIPSGRWWDLTQYTSIGNFTEIYNYTSRMDIGYRLIAKRASISDALPTFTIEPAAALLPKCGSISPILDGYTPSNETHIAEYAYNSGNISWSYTEISSCEYMSYKIEDTTITVYSDTPLIHDTRFTEDLVIFGTYKYSLNTICDMTPTGISVNIGEEAVTVPLQQVTFTPIKFHDKTICFRSDSCPDLECDVPVSGSAVWNGASFSNSGEHLVPTPIRATNYSEVLSLYKNHYVCIKTLTGKVRCDGCSQTGCRGDEIVDISTCEFEAEVDRDGYWGIMPLIYPESNCDNVDTTTINSELTIPRKSAATEITDVSEIGEYNPLTGMLWTILFLCMIALLLCIFVTITGMCYVGSKLGRKVLRVIDRMGESEEERLVSSNNPVFHTKIVESPDSPDT